MYTYNRAERKRVCDFLLVINSNLGPILPRFRDIAGFPFRKPTPPLFHPNFGGVPLGVDYRCCGSEERRPQANYSCNYFRTNSTHAPTVHQRHRQTDGRTDRRTTYDRNTALALRALRGKKAAATKVSALGMGRYIEISIYGLSF